MAISSYAYFPIVVFSVRSDHATLAACTLELYLAIVSLDVWNLGLNLIVLYYKTDRAVMTFGRHT